jgi:hypothetical protein
MAGGGEGGDAARQEIDEVLAAVAIAARQLGDGVRVGGSSSAATSEISKLRLPA